jgi:hypothetical protein
MSFWKSLLTTSLLLPGVLSCSKEEYRAKFGVEPTYELLASPEPRLAGSGDTVVAHVRYTTRCRDGGSRFKAVAKSMPPGMDTFDVTLLERFAPACDDPLPVSTTWEGKVEVPLPAFKNNGLKAKPLMIAFPPDGAYEVYMLRSAYPPKASSPLSSPPPAFGAAPTASSDATEFEPYDEYAGMSPEEKTAKVQRELASQDAEDSINHLAHCLETPEDERVSCCCDEMIEGLKKKVAEDAANAVMVSANATEEEEQNAGGVEVGASGSVVGSLMDGLK